VYLHERNCRSQFNAGRHAGVRAFGSFSVVMPLFNKDISSDGKYLVGRALHEKGLVISHSARKTPDCRQYYLHPIE